MIRTNLRHLPCSVLTLQLRQILEELLRFGLASASWFFTGRPWITLRTASSTILPLMVRGISATSIILAGRRGLAPSRICFRGAVPARQSGCVRCIMHKQDDAHIALPILANRHGSHDFGKTLHLAVDFCCANTHSAGFSTVSERP